MYGGARRGGGGRGYNGLLLDGQSGPLLLMEKRALHLLLYTQKVMILVRASGNSNVQGERKITSPQLSKGRPESTC